MRVSESVHPLSYQRRARMTKRPSQWEFGSPHRGSRVRKSAGIFRSSDRSIMEPKLRAATVASAHDRASAVVCIFTYDTRNTHIHIHTHIHLHTHIHTHACTCERMRRSGCTPGERKRNREQERERERERERDRERRTDRVRMYSRPEAIPKIIPSAASKTQFPGQNLMIDRPTRQELIGFPGAAN